ncbi:MAG: FecR domain-containing protein [Myxococcales bacterium]|jgi:hypothetical protein
MSERRFTELTEEGRSLPRLPEGGAGRVARELREQGDALDDFSRARMERAMLQAWRTRAAAHVPLPSRRLRRRGRARAMWAASIAASAFAGAVLGLIMLDAERPTTVPAGTARFELRIGDAAVQSGSVAEGQLLESGKHGHIEVNLGDARVDMGRETRLRFERIDADELALSLSRGRVDVDFHPERKGEQRLSVSSRAARVNVIGTRFSVTVDALGNTDVEVRQGVVEVVPRSGAPTRRVAAGERLQVRVDDGDSYERAVRNAIEDRLAEAAPAVQTGPSGEGVDGTDVAFEDADAAPDMDFSDLVAPGPSRPRVDDVTAHPARRSVATPPSPAELEQALTAARELLRKGQHAAARARLTAMAEGEAPTRYRLEALTLVAESLTAQGYIPRARRAYERAVSIAPAHPAALNAQFALARLLERYTHDAEAAARVYRGYLARAPSGALAGQAREALCRLGDALHCK